MLICLQGVNGVGLTMKGFYAGGTYNESGPLTPPILNYVGLNCIGFYSSHGAKRSPLMPP